MRKKNVYDELPELFFATRQVIRETLGGKHPDPNAWMRFETLRYIGRVGNPSMRDLARHLRVRPPSATSLVAHLVRERWVLRDRIEGDKRTVRVRLSARGKAALAGYRRRSEGAMRRVFARLGERETRTLARILRRVSGRVEK